MLSDKKSILEKAAQKGDTEAIFQLGLMYWEGNDVEPDFEKAKNLIGAAKRKGHPVADMYWDIIQSNVEV